jgi:sortase A
MRRGIRALSSVLIIAGIMLLVDAGLTIAWQEPVSAIYARITQNKLKGDLRDLGKAPVSRATRRALARLGKNTDARMAVLARELRRKVHNGQAIGRIVIPRIDASYVVVQGTDTASLRKGPGHYPATPFPGMPGTVAIAGHRTTYLAPFRKVDKLRHGDPIRLEMPYGRFTYRVQYTKIVQPTALYITRSVGYDRLVLSACHPLYSASHRIVVFAKLVSKVPEGHARMGS